jgi:hypothetical protein
MTVKGITPVAPSPGAAVAVAPGSETKLHYLRELLRAIDAKNLQGDIDGVDVSNISGITFLYKGVAVVMGSGEDAGYKLDKMISAEEEARRSGTPAGKIDVSRDGHTNVLENTDG